MKIVLASKSPRRRELISLLGNEILIYPSSADEENIKAPPKKLPEALSLLKAKEVANIYPDELVLGCDTVVICKGKILGKPKDKADAERMLKLLSGKKHTVISGVSLIKGEKTVSFYEKTYVYFRRLTDEKIAEYIETGEPMDKAGAYGIQGKGSLFVKKIKGDYFNVVGLPVSKTAEMIKKHFD